MDAFPLALARIQRPRRTWESCSAPPSLHSSISRSGDRFWYENQAVAGLVMRSSQVQEFSMSKLIEYNAGAHLGTLSTWKSHR